jgi:hypothetical protein
VKLTLRVHYTDEYPDCLPEMALQVVEGELDDQELQDLLHELHTVVRRQNVQI